MNTQRFQVGDVVRIIETSPLEEIRRDRADRAEIALMKHDGELVHMLDLEPSPGYRGVCAPPRALQLVYDGRRRVSWSSCVWQPRDVELPAFLRPQAG